MMADMLSALEQSILKTVAWFSLFETPVTVFEIWKWMLEPDRSYSLEETYAALAGEGLRGHLFGERGYWSLRVRSARNAGDIGHFASVSERRARFLDAARKYAKLRRATRYLSILPWIEGVAAGNTLAWWNTRPESDIDLFIIARPGSIWLARLFAVAPFAIFGKRPGASEIDSFCFSFFATADALDLSALALQGGDPYLAYWARSLVPILDRGGIFERFRTENAWATSELPHSRRFDSQTSHFFAQPSNTRCWMVERIARKIQMSRFPMRIRRMMNVDTCVVVTDRVLKFHDNDRREEYRDRLREITSYV